MFAYLLSSLKATVVTRGARNCALPTIFIATAALLPVCLPTPQAVIASPQPVATTESRDNTGTTRTVRGVVVQTSAESFKFPRGWKNMAMVPLREADLPRTLQLLEVALSKYPEPVLQEYLLEVFVLHAIKVDDYQIGGTETWRRVFVAIDLHSDEVIEGTFHHEFAGSLYHHEDSRRRSEDQWKACLPEGFQYENNPQGALARGFKYLRLDPEFGKQGFVSNYAATEISNDFCETAREVFLNKPDFWEFVDKHPLVKRKVDLVIDYYHKLDESFEYDYFRNLPNNGRLSLVPEPLTPEQIKQLTRTETIDRLAKIARAKSIVKDLHEPEVMTELEEEFKLLMKQLESFRNSQGNC